MFGEDAHPTMHLEAAALMHSSVRNPALVDGNKRLARLATWVFLDLNGIPPIVDDDDAVEFVLSVADGTLDDLPKIAARLESWPPSS